MRCSSSTFFILRFCWGELLKLSTLSRRHWSTFHFIFYIAFDWKNKNNNWTVCFQVFTLTRYLYGPFSPALCQIDYLLKNILVLKILCFANFALAVRYIFIAHSKNPTAVQDLFWSIFLECWATGMKVSFWYPLNLALIWVFSFNFPNLYHFALWNWEEMCLCNVEQMRWSLWWRGC